MAHEEKRRYVRHYFSLSETLKFQIQLANGTPHTWPATLLCLGGGGLGFVIPRHLTAGIRKGSQIRIASEHMPQDLSLIHGLLCEVVYILDNDTSIYLSFGCHFIRITKAKRERVIANVTARNHAIIAAK